MSFSCLNYSKRLLPRIYVFSDYIVTNLYRECKIKTLFPHYNRVYVQKKSTDTAM